MLFALRLALPRGLAAATAQRLQRVVLALTPEPLPELEPASVMALLARDKKAREGGVGWVLPRALGQGRWGVAVPAAEVEEQLAAFLRDPLA